MKKAKITCVGGIIDGNAYGWAIEGGDYPGIDISKKTLGGWTFDELTEIRRVVLGVITHTVELC
jgi:hypothetical protein